MNTTSALPLHGGMDIEAFRKHGYKVVDQICDYYAHLNELPVVSQVEPGYLVNDLPTEAPVQPEETFDVVISDFKTKILPGITHWSHPRFFAYFPAITNFESILADMMATSVSNPGFNWSCSPACTELEQVMLDWAAKLLGLQETFWNSSKKGGGQITGAASESAIVATVAARERCFRMLSLQNVPLTQDPSHPSDNEQLPAVKTDELGTRINDADTDIDDDVRDRYHSKLIMYGSTQTHSIGIKAAKILGLKWKSLPTYPKDDFALTGETVRAALEEDEKKGLVPFMLIGTIGTTSSGAVDRLEEIGQVLKDHPNVFLYIDAAWAGTALSVPEYRESLQLDAVNKYADGICTNFHKWGLVAFDCSALWVRDRRVLTNALDVTPAFLRTKHGDTGVVVDYRNWSLSLGRRFRSLKLWFVLRSYGVEGFRAHIRMGVSMAALVEKRIQQSKNFELAAPRSLALVVFRLRPANGDYSVTQLNDLNKRLQESVHAQQAFNMTQTVLPGNSGEPNIDCLRFAMGGLRTTEADVLSVWETVEELGRAIIKDA